MENSKDYQNRLFQILNNEAFSSRFIAGIAGDRIQNPDEKKLYDKILKESNGDLYVKLLFFITHEVFEKEHAMQLWNEILIHKKNLTKMLNRNVEITVATLDYLTNIKNEITGPKIIGEAFIGKIAELSSIDPLTKIFNRQHLLQVLKDEHARYVRYNISFSLIMIDVDHFKRVNDMFGHQKGDKVLIEISKVIQSNLRELDVCTRYGGDEFLVVLPHTNHSRAYKIGDRIRHKVEVLSSVLHGITVSVGVACCPYNTMSIDSLVKAVDEAVYVAKNSGKNKTILGPPK